MIQRKRFVKQGLAVLLSLSMALGPCAPGTITVLAAGQESQEADITETEENLGENNMSEESGSEEADTGKQGNEESGGSGGESTEEGSVESSEEDSGESAEESGEESAVGSGGEDAEESSVGGSGENSGDAEVSEENDDRSGEAEDGGSEEAADAGKEEAEDAGEEDPSDETEDVSDRSEETEDPAETVTADETEDSDASEGDKKEGEETSEEIPAEDDAAREDGTASEEAADAADGTVPAEETLNPEESTEEADKNENAGTSGSGGAAGGKTISAAEVPEAEATAEEETTGGAFQTAADGVIVTVRWDKDVLPANTVMEIEKAEENSPETLEAARAAYKIFSEDSADRVKNAAAVNTAVYKIIALDGDGEEVQPDTEKGKLTVLFSEIVRPAALNGTAASDEALHVFRAEDGSFEVLKELEAETGAEISEEGSGSEESTAIAAEGTVVNDLEEKTDSEDQDNSGTETDAEDAASKEALPASAAIASEEFGAFVLSWELEAGGAEKAELSEGEEEPLAVLLGDQEYEILSAGILKGTDCAELDETAWTLKGLKAGKVTLEAAFITETAGKENSFYRELPMEILKKEKKAELREWKKELTPSVIVRDVRSLAKSDDIDAEQAEAAAAPAEEEIAEAAAKLSPEAKDIYEKLKEQTEKAAEGENPEVGLSFENVFALEYETFPETEILQSAMDEKSEIFAEHFQNALDLLFTEYGNALWFEKAVLTRTAAETAAEEKTVYDVSFTAALPEIKDGLLLSAKLLQADSDFVIDNNGVLTKYNGSARTVTIPSNVREIGSDAFEGNSTLTTLTIPGTVLTVGTGAFRNCAALTSLTIKEGVQYLNDGSFRGCTALTTVSIPASIRELNGNSKWYGEGGCFQGCTSLQSVTFQSGRLSLIGEYAFADDTSLRSISLPSGLEEVGPYTFRGCTALRSVSVPGSVKTIGEAAFINCTGLLSIEIPKGVTGIGNSCFENCSGIRTASIAGTVDIIPFKAFYRCSSLTTLSLAEGTGSIGACAFADCVSLKDVTIPSSVITLWGQRYQGGCFSGCTSLTSVTLKGGKLEEIKEYAFDGDSSLEKIVIPSGTVSIGDYAFRNCGGLKSVSIPSSCASIGAYAFENAVLLESLTLPEGVTRIGEGAFNSCTSLKRLSIAGTVSEMGWYAFQKCTSLTELTLGEGLLSLPVGGFYECTALKTVQFPSSLKYIYGASYKVGCFENCSSLENITFQKGSLTQIGSGAFAFCTGLKSVVLPDGLTIIDQYAFLACTQMEVLVIPSTVTTINYRAFCDNDSLRTVVLPFGVTTLHSAFQDCDYLESAYIPSTVTTIDNSFSGSTKYLTIYGTAGSGAQTYANNNSIPFVATDVEAEVQKFVKQVFQNFLNRAPSTTDVTSRADKLLLLTTTAADVVNGIYRSNEYKNRDKNLTDTQFITTAFKAVLGRAPSTSEKNSCISWLNDDGVSRDFIIYHLTSSAEFRNNCAKIWIEPGTFKVTENRDKNHNVTKYVQRYYTIILGRKADTGGLNYWCGQLISRTKGGAAVAQNFFGSSELKNKNLANLEVTKLLYKTMMGREADAGGAAYWCEFLDSGMSPVFLVNQFAASNEFKTLCTNAGILPGKANLTEARDVNQGVTRYVVRLYTKVLGRAYDVDGLNYWCRTINNAKNKKSPVISSARSFVSSGEFTRKNYSNTDYVKILYRTFLNREADSSGLQNWVNRLNSGQDTRITMLNNFVNSGEFKNLMKNYGITL